MNGHDTFLDLAAVAIDFELSGAERARLEAHLAGCPACRRGAEALGADARSIAALPVVRLSERRADALLASVLAPPRASLRSLRLLAVAGLLALLAVGSVLVGAELLRQRDRDDLSVLPVPSASVDPDASPVVPLVWTQVASLPDTSWLVDPWPIVGFDRGYVAAMPAGDAAASIRFTADGVAWETVALPAPDGAVARAATSAGGTVVVVGGYPHDPCTPKEVGGGNDCPFSPIAWTSTDGIAWQSSLPWVGPLGDEDPVLGSEFSDVWAVPGGWEASLLYWSGAAHNQREVWYSADGLAWELRATVHDEGFDLERMAAIGADGTRILSTVTPVSDDRVRLWVSDDGAAWSDLAVPEGAARITAGVGPSAPADPWLLSGRGCGDGADGPQSCGRPTIWASTDLGSWRPVVLPGIEALEVEMAAAGFGAPDIDVVVARASFGYVSVAWAYGGAGGVAAAWSSADGVTWAAVDGTPLVRSLADGPSGVIAIGVPDDTGVTPMYVLRSESVVTPSQAPGSPQPSPSASTATVIGARWERVDLPDDSVPAAGGSMDGVIAGGPGSIAWAQVYGEVSRIWTTADGRTWQRATVETPPDAAPEDQEPGFISSVAAGGPGHVAVGWYSHLDTGRRGVIWTSVDGRAWDVTPYDPIFENVLISRVVAWHGELLAYGVRSFGADEGQGDQLAWSSSDGLTWKAEVLSLSTGLRHGAPIVGADRLWASGEPVDADPLAGWQQTCWLTSVDGRTWSVATLPFHPGSVMPVSDGLIMLTLPAWMTGSSAGERLAPGAYRSTDLETWQLVSGDEAPYGELTEVDTTYVVVGDDSDADTQCPDACRPVGWRSEDGGVTWAGVAADDVTGTMLHVAALPDGTLVAVGRVFGAGADAGPAAWVSPPASP